MERKPFTRALNDAQKPFYVGIDLGGTNIKIGLVDSNGSTYYRHSVPTEHERGPDDGARAALLDLSFSTPRTEAAPRGR